MTRTGFGGVGGNPIMLDAGIPTDAPEDEQIVDTQQALRAAIRAAELALFVIRKQGVMPNSSWEAGFNADLAIAKAGLIEPERRADGGADIVMTHTDIALPAKREEKEWHLEGGEAVTFSTIDKFHLIQGETRHAIVVSLGMKGASKEERETHMARVKGLLAVRDDYEQMAYRANPDWEPEWAEIDRHYDK